MDSMRLSDGNTIPLLGLGTWQMTGDACREAVATALKEGYRHIDTAEAYGNEADVGRGLKDAAIPREEIFLTSKLWIDNFSFEKALKACEASLERLGTDYLDLYLIHWPDSSKELRPVLEAMKKLIDDGKIKSFGVSNFTAAHIEKAYSLSKSIGVHPVINQVEFHPGLYQKELQEYCKDKDIMLTAYSPLGRGRSIEYDIFQELAEKYNKTKSQIALRWALDRDVVVIPKSSSKEHIQENLEIFDFTLDDEDASAIDSLGDDQRILDPGFAEFDRKDVFEKD